MRLYLKLLGCSNRPCIFRFKLTVYNSPTIRLIYSLRPPHQDTNSPNNPIELTLTFTRFGGHCLECELCPQNRNLVRVETLLTDPYPPLLCAPPRAPEPPPIPHGAYTAYTSITASGIRVRSHVEQRWELG